MKGKTAQNRKRNKHHLTPRSRGGETTASNLLLIEIKRHDAWHVLWGNRTLDEVIALLKRLKQIKASKRFRAYL